jgi:hypothetical protein
VADETVGLLRVVLTANTSEFSAALSGAEVKLGHFERETRKVSSSLSRMVEGFSGQRVVAEAQKMVEAVQRVGGASSLTASEQSKVNHTVSEAIAKYTALGQTAPASMLALQQATSGAVEKTSMLTRGMQGLIALVSARAIVGMASDVLDLTSKLSDLAAKTGMSAEALQRLSFVTSQSGVSLEQIATGATKLGRALVEGDKSAVKAVQALGLEVQELIAMGPEGAFLAIGEAIAKVPNPMEKAALATAIFGRAGAEYLPAFTTNMTQLAAEAQRSGAILSNDLVAAGDKAGDAFTRLKAAGTAVIGQLFLPIVPALEVVATWLANNIPSAVNAARNAFDGLLRKGLELQVWLYNLAVSISETVREVPVLGRVFGVAAGDVDELRKMAQHAKDSLNSFNAQGVKPVVQGMQSAIPITTSYGEAVDKVATSSRRAAQAVGEIKPPVEAFTGLVSRSLVATADLTRQLESWARTNGAVLAPSIYQVNAALEAQEPLVAEQMLIWSQFPGTVQESTTRAGSGIAGFFKQVFGGSEELGRNISSMFQTAFMGGGGAIGAVKAFATQTLGTLLGMIPGLGPFLSGFAGPIVAMLSNLGKKVGDFFKRLFGGPSADEVAGRGAVGAFEDQLAGSLNAAQQAEAGGERWKQTVIAIRDAYLAVGRSEREALADAEKLWASSRQGAEASKAVIDEITKKMQEQAEAYGEAGEASAEGAEDAGEVAEKAIDKLGDKSVHTIEEILKALGKIPSDLHINVHGHYQAPDIPDEGSQGFASGTLGRTGRFFNNFGSGTPAMLHGMEAVINRQQAIPFAMSMLDGIGSKIGALQPAGASVSANVMLLPVPAGGADSFQIARDVIRHLPREFDTNSSGLVTRIESLVEDYLRTYGGGRG